MGKHIILLATLDTKGIEAGFIKKLVEERGHRIVLIDTNTGGEAVIKPDISAAEIALHGGSSIEKVRQMTDTSKTSSIMIQGAVKVLGGLLARGELDGIVSFGGASNTTLSTTIMKALPFGIPKVMLSSTAAMPAYAASYFGTKDIAILHSVIDIVGSNPLVKDVLARAAGMICGMVECSTGESLLTKKSDKKMVALTEFKFSEPCCSYIRKNLEEKGFEVIPFHAQGTSDRAMEELILDDLFQSVIDIVPAGVSEELLGGNRAAGKGRLESAGKKGIPQIITPCGFDMLSCGPLDRREKSDPLWIKRKLADRALFIPDAFRVQARTTIEELTEIAGEVAGKLNQAKGPVVVMVPTSGWSSLDREGMPLYDPKADKHFIEVLRSKLDSHIKVVLLPCHLNSIEFAEEVVRQFTTFLTK